MSGSVTSVIANANTIESDPASLLDHVTFGKRRK